MNVDKQFTTNGKPIIEIHLGEHIVIRKPGGDEVRIPIDKYGNLFLDFVGTIHSFNSVHFADVGTAAVRGLEIGFVPADLRGIQTPSELPGPEKRCRMRHACGQAPLALGLQTPNPPQPGSQSIPQTPRQ